VTFLQRMGRRVTRLLLRPGLRESRLVSELYTFAYLSAKHVAERRQRAFLRSLVRPGMVVFDVGANAGFYAIALSRWVGPQGRVHAFEPDPVSFALLRRRAERSGSRNLELSPTAVGDHEGTVWLHCGAMNRADNRVHASHPAGETA
jgi:predicted O-methyltransferase YrrM